MVYCGEGEHAASPQARGADRNEPSGFKNKNPDPVGRDSVCLVGSYCDDLLMGCSDG